jgi:outer membrane protein OmpA-like peptidoglycan-associated protein
MSANLLHAQSAYQKQIDKAKFAKIEKKLNKVLKKTPEDPVANFYLGVIYINRGFTSYNPYTSFDYLQKSQRGFDMVIDEKEMKKLLKLPLDQSIYANYRDTVYMRGLEDAIAANSVEAYEKYLSYFPNADFKYTSNAITKRDIAAYKVATDKNTVESYQYFIDRYPFANQKNQAITERNSRAYENAKAIDKIDAYYAFIDKYPDANDIPRAWERIHELAYQDAEKENTIGAFEKFIGKFPKAKQVNSARENIYKIAFEETKIINTITAYEQFIRKYPNSKQSKEAENKIHEIAFDVAYRVNTSYAYKEFITKYPGSSNYNKAYSLFEEREYQENIKIGDFESYLSFIENFPTNSWKSRALDSLFVFCASTEDYKLLENTIVHFSGEIRRVLLLKLHDLYTNDGELSTLNKFYDKYEDPIFNEIKSIDYELAREGNYLYFYRPYESTDFEEYDNYIRKAAPREKAYVALQKMIAKELNQKNWQEALRIVKNYKNYFGENHKNFNNLIVLLEDKYNSNVKIQALGFNVNTKDGGEYIPVISADDNLILFCGRNRKDNLGGEDIFYANLKKQTQAKVLTELSSYFNNDAPVSISTDGTLMIFFRDGKLFTAEKTKDGWSNIAELSDVINSGLWQADAMISSDGNALLFASVRKENYDYNYKLDLGLYHGETEYASDIYVCLKDDMGKWGTPINLGANINTIYGDRSPFLHPDMKSLYFSSSGHGGIGAMDVFKSTRLSDTCWTCWSEPVNMGKEINSSGRDWGYMISTDGNKAYFAKNMDNKEDDIYSLNLPQHLRPDYVATVSGKLVDSKNKAISTRIIWEDLEAKKTIGVARTDPKDGAYFIVLPMGKNYGYYIEDTTYFPISTNLDLRNTNKAVELKNDISAVTFNEMINEGIGVTINNLFFEFAKYNVLPQSIPELQRVANIINSKNLKVEISGHTDNVGDDKTNQKLSEMRASAVKDFLVSLGCNPALLNTSGFGKSKPIAPNDTDLGRAKNRRVELKFVK